MAVAIPFVPVRVGAGDYTDFQAVAGAGDNGKVWAWSDAQQKFVPVALNYEPAGEVATHAALTSGVHGISAFGATLIDDAAASNARATLGLGTIATEVETNYLLATGARTGASSQAQTFTSGVNLSNLTSGRVPYVTTAGLITDDAGLTYDAANDALTVVGRVVTGTFRAPSDGATAFQFQRAAGDESVLTINTTDGIVVVNPLGTTTRGLMIGNGTFPGSLSLYAYGHSPGFRQTVARSSGFFAMTFIDGRAKNTTTSLESALVQFGIFGNLQSGSTQPSLVYAYMSSLVSPAYNNANFFMLSTGEIGVGTGNSSPTAVIDLAASTTARASARIRSGVAPTTKNDGDVWYDGTHLYMRIAGVDKQLDN